MSKKFDDDFFGCAESCPKMRDRGLEIQKLNEKICAYKAKVRDLYQVDISDLKKTIRCLKERIEELECENEYLTLENDQLCDASFANEVDELMKSNDELEKALDDMREENSKLEILKQHLLNHLSNKEAEIVNLKEENEKLAQALKTDINRVHGVESSLESQLAVRDASSIWESVVISYPKGKKISNVELYFQEEVTE